MRYDLGNSTQQAGSCDYICVSINLSSRRKVACTLWGNTDLPNCYGKKGVKLRMTWLWVQEAETPRLKRIIVLLHKIGESLHAAQTSDHPNNTAGAKLVTSFLTKLANSVRPASLAAGKALGPIAADPTPDRHQADSVMSEAGGEEEEEVKLCSALQAFLSSCSALCTMQGSLAARK